MVRGGFRQSRRFALIHHLVQKYKFKFYVKVEQISIQSDHLHLLIRTTRRSNYQSFFRVVAGQIAQQFEKQGLLTVAVTDTPGELSRYFTRVVKSWKAYQTVRDYIQLNEKEAIGEITYQKRRLKGFSQSEWEALWT